MLRRCTLCVYLAARPVPCGASVCCDQSNTDTLLSSNLQSLGISWGTQPGAQVRNDMHWHNNEHSFHFIKHVDRELGCTTNIIVSIERPDQQLSISKKIYILLLYTSLKTFNELIKQFFTSLVARYMTALLLQMNKMQTWVFIVLDCRY